MRIVHQSALDSHSPFFVSPYLMLPPPRIAGLLPSGIADSAQKAAPAPFTFDRPALADLTEAQRDRLFEAADMLLEIAIEFMIGTFNESVLRAGEVLFHRAAGGKSAIRPLGPDAFNAELDADWLELVARAKRARPLSDSEAATIVNMARNVRRGGAA